MANDGSRVTYHLTRGPADRSPCDTLQAQSGLFALAKVAPNYRLDAG